MTRTVSKKIYYLKDSVIEGFIYELFSCFMENMAISVVKFSSKTGIQKLTNFDPKLNILFIGK